jgi:hypothetical protein
LRCLLPDSRFHVFAEPDKGGHEIIKGAPKPDFIYHVPGTMDENISVIEVKQSEETNEKRILNTLLTLKKFVEHFRYKLGIFLVFGKNLHPHFLELYDELLDLDTRFCFIHHLSAGRKPKLLRNEI